MKLVLVITCFGEQFGINCPSAILKMLWLPKLNEGNFKFSKITRVIYFQNSPSKACDYWLCIKPGIQERGTERGEWGECYIPVNVAKHSGECPIYFDGRELIEASTITVVFSVALLIVCSVIFCVKNLAKLLAARLNSGENLISMPWKSFEKFLLVSATQAPLVLLI